MEYRLNILLKLIYGEFIVDDTIYHWINKCLSDETEVIRKRRIEDNKRLLQDHVNQDGTIIIVYRGTKQGTVNTFELSWSVSYEVARYFATRKGNGRIITGMAKINDVLTYNSNIRENEVIILPENVKTISVEQVKYDEEFLNRWEQDGKEFDYKMKEFIKSGRKSK